MKKITTGELLALISEALGVDAALIDLNTTAEGISEWDSLTQLNILLKLDEHLDGNVVAIKDLAIATSVQDIADILSRHGLFKA